MWRRRQGRYSLSSLPYLPERVPPHPCTHQCVLGLHPFHSLLTLCLQTAGASEHISRSWLCSTVYILQLLGKLFVSKEKGPWQPNPCLDKREGRGRKSTGQWPEAAARRPWSAPKSSGISADLFQFSKPSFFQPIK